MGAYAGLGYAREVKLPQRSPSAGHTDGHGHLLDHVALHCIRLVPARFESTRFEEVNH